jgi:2-amino-4-hydroxy-6-hydroxymethyldihydropteridine diphosphokinase
MSPLYLLIGGNQGNRQQIINNATNLIQQRIGFVAVSSHIYETEPWGDFQDPNTQPFLNIALLVHTNLTPLQALSSALLIEKELGRQRIGLPSSSELRTYSSRPIDIDLIFFGNLVINTPTLTLPHPRMHLRRFVLKPLCDIAPDYIHPLFNKTLNTLLSECTDPCSCSCYC